MKTFIRISKAAKFICLDSRKRSGERMAKTHEILAFYPHRYDHIKTKSEL